MFNTASLIEWTQEFPDYVTNTDWFKLTRDDEAFEGIFSPHRLVKDTFLNHCEFPKRFNNIWVHPVT